MSKLASIQRIVDVQPIPGADNIEVVTVLGWQIVTKKGEYKIGDLCTYIQIDTVVPAEKQFEFLESRKYRVKTIKLKGQISQGLIIPAVEGKKEYDDVTSIIGVTKYSKVDNNPKEKRPKAPKKWYRKWIYLFKYNVLYKLFPNLEQKTSDPFPTDIVSKTDEERIQNIPGVLHKYKGKKFVVSYKLDGSSITIINNKTGYRICSRNRELFTNDNEWVRTFQETQFYKHMENLVDLYGQHVIVQGEMIGKPNGNHHKLDKNEIRLFNIIVNGKRLSPEQFVAVCNHYSIPHCPVFATLTLNHTMEEVLKMSEIKDCINPKVEAEGLVWRSVDGSLSFKAINNKYLLKHE